MMTSLGEGIWCARQDLKLVGCNFGGRMTVVRLPGNELWVYSPIRLTDALKAALDKVGTVAHLIAPNPFHHLFLNGYRAAYPAAKVYGMPELVKKRPDLTGMTLLTEIPPDAFGPSLKFMALEGKAGFRELIACHEPSGTIVVCDIAFNLQIATTMWEQIFFRLYGVKGKFGPSLLARTMIKSAKCRAIWQNILSWNFNRVVPCHGEILDRNAKAVFRQAFRFME